MTVHYAIRPGFLYRPLCQSSATWRSAPMTTEPETVTCKRCRGMLARRAEYAEKRAARVSRIIASYAEQARDVVSEGDAALDNDATEYNPLTGRRFDGRDGGGD